MDKSILSCISSTTGFDLSSRPSRFDGENLRSRIYMLECPQDSLGGASSAMHSIHLIYIRGCGRLQHVIGRRV